MNKKKKFDLPVFHKDGVLLSVAENSKGKIYLVQKSPELFVNEKAELLGIMFDNIVFRQPLKFENNEASGLIPLKDLPPGILHLSVVNENEQVFAFRPVMINKTDIYADVLFSKDTVGFSPKAKNVFSFRLPDTTEGNLSVSVIALNSTNAAIENNSITNSILIDAESSLPAIHQQRFKGKEGQNDIMALAGQWKQPVIKKHDVTVTDNYISVSGKVFKYGSKKVVTKGTLLVYLQTKDSLNTFLRFL